MMKAVKSYPCPHSILVDGIEQRCQATNPHSKHWAYTNHPVASGRGREGWDGRARARIYWFARLVPQQAH